MAAVDRPTARVSNIPQTASAADLVTFLESVIGKHSVYACEIFSEHRGWKSRGHGRVQFETLEDKATAASLSHRHKLVFKGSNLLFSRSFDDVVPRPIDPDHRQTGGVLYAGFLAGERRMSVVESWEGVKAWVMPERKRVEFWIEAEGEWFKLEVCFGDLQETCLVSLGCEENPNAVLLTLKRGPKVYKRMSGPNVDLKFCVDRYHVCKEKVDYIWVRTTDFSALNSIGYSSLFCWEIDERTSDLDIFTSFPYFREDSRDLTLEDGEEYAAASEVVPLVNCKSDSKLDYEVIFQLNSLLHAQRISLAAVDDNVISILSSLSLDTAIMILKKLHKRDIVYDLFSFIKMELHVLRKKSKNLPLSSASKLTEHNIMSCHRVLITPTRIYCLGPELETSNYVVKHFAPYASDFLRVSFVEEDWSKLGPNAISTFIKRGIFAKPFRTGVYNRMLSILQEGLVIGDKKFEFLAFSASQLRSNSVWMFASNEKVTAEDIREWMGCFKKIRSISKCAARMGQLFSSSTQTLVVPENDVEIIPDVEVVCNGVGYCFSDGIGKISFAFAKQVAQKCGLKEIPSAFQIRYGGYKGVVAVDRSSYHKLSLRNSMLKFESNNRMLNVTKCSDPMPCYLNREIVTLLSTLGVEDQVFEAMQNQQISLLDKMLTSREAALDVLESISGIDNKNIVAKMLLQGYEPNVEPFISMMLQAHRENQLSDLRSRCRIYVPKGRILLGCLDESGILNYGQVFVRVTMTKLELQSENQTFFKKVDEATSIVMGKVIVTRNPCLHPGDIRVLEAVFEVVLEEKGLVDCILFPQNGERPHPSECSGGDLDGDLYFISWDQDLIPKRTVSPMDYTGTSTRIMDHDVTLKEIQEFFIDYMINDTLGTISTAHLVHADHESDKAESRKCLQLAELHSMAVDFAKTGAPAEMPRYLKPKEFPDFMERLDKPRYISQGVLGKLYRATIGLKYNERSKFVWSEMIAEAAYDRDLEVSGFEAFLEIASAHKELYIEKMLSLFSYYGARSEDEILTGNLRGRALFLQRDNRKYGEVKDRISTSFRSLQKEAKGWFESCTVSERPRLASAWYHVTYHPTHCQNSGDCLSFPWTVGDILLNIKSLNARKSLSGTIAGANAAVGDEAMVID